MKINVRVLAMALFLLSPATGSFLFGEGGTGEVAAENYPYRSDFLWVTSPNHADWLYKTGEKAVIDVQLYKYGVAVTADVNS